MANPGFDYDHLKERSRKDKAGLGGFFLVGLTTDAAASEEYSDELGRLLEHWGEGAFLDTLATVGSRVREHVLSHLAYDAGYGESDQSWSQFRVRYPRVAGLIVRQDYF